MQRGTVWRPLNSVTALNPPLKLNRAEIEQFSLAGVVDRKAPTLVRATHPVWSLIWYRRTAPAVGGSLQR